jgi:nucleotide-binding universal stress UspA family protein
MPYKRILVPLDGSKLAEAALQHVVNIAAPDAYVHIISVASEGTTTEAAKLASATGEHPPADEQWPYIHAPQDPRHNNARDEYLKSVQEWLQPLGYDVVTETQPGEIIDTIVRIANQGYDIIVMSTHGRSGIARTIVGSVAEAVLHQAPCPVLLIPARAVK